MYYILFLTLFQALQINNGMHVGQYPEEVEKRAEDKYDEPDVQLDVDFTEDELSLALSNLFSNELDILKSAIVENHNQKREASYDVPEETKHFKPQRHKLSRKGFIKSESVDPVQRIHQDIASLRKESQKRAETKLNSKVIRKKREGADPSKSRKCILPLFYFKKTSSSKQANKNASTDGQYIKLLEDSFPNEPESSAIKSDQILVRVKRVA
ncbi:uncharacterized protein LOC119653273 isoform X2 [Hermetia illucens]|uniref:uncharacterized protein LOC119653273 isoform X2 n=1 Tax=Hermetia illucens TaxID=343691 RepID=UPI0018CC0363|nr:uncharacterized protein LOC119653273 isoform X2 [Hermetia illucens]